jgi:hypothetical protein
MFLHPIEFTFAGFRPDATFRPEEFAEQALVRSIQRGQSGEVGRFVGQLFAWCGMTPVKTFFDHRMFRGSKGKFALQWALTEQPAWISLRPAQFLALAHENASRRTGVEGSIHVDHWGSPFVLQYELIPEKELNKIATHLTKLSYCRNSMLFDMLPYLTRLSPGLLKRLQAHYSQHQIAHAFESASRKTTPPTNGEGTQLKHAGEAGHAKAV